MSDQIIDAGAAQRLQAYSQRTFPMAGLERSDRQPADPPEVIAVWFAEFARPKP